MTSSLSEGDAERRARSRTAGLAAAVSAYALWGLFPIYFRAVSAAPPLQVLAHRIVWSVVVVGVALTLATGWRAVGAAFRRPRVLGALALSALAISSSWGVFILAVSSGRVLEASLGYFINPLMSVLLAVVVLRERLRPAQWAAIGIAGGAVAMEVATVGEWPWMALAMATSFAIYGLIRKLAAVEALPGLFLETALLAPFALAWLLARADEGALWLDDPAFAALLALSGPITAAPLALFVFGARRIPLSTAGLLQYIAPTGHFLLAVFAFGERLSTPRLAAFALIWLALAIYGLDAWRRSGLATDRADRASRRSARE